VFKSRLASLNVVQEGGIAVPVGIAKEASEVTKKSRLRKRASRCEFKAAISSLRKHLLGGQHPQQAIKGLRM